MEHLQTPTLTYPRLNNQSKTRGSGRWRALPGGTCSCSARKLGSFLRSQPDTPGCWVTYRTINAGSLQHYATSGFHSLVSIQLPTSTLAPRQRRKRNHAAAKREAEKIADVPNSELPYTSVARITSTTGWSNVKEVISGERAIQPACRVANWDSISWPQARLKRNFPIAAIRRRA